MSKWLNKVGNQTSFPMAPAEREPQSMGNLQYYNPNLTLCKLGPMQGQMVDLSQLTNEEVDACFLPTPSHIPFDNPSYEGDTHMDCYDCANKSAAPQRFIIGDHINDDGTTGCPSGTIQSNLNINRTNQSTNPCVSGCTQSSATNYSEVANTDDGSCEFDLEEEEEVVEEILEEEIEEENKELKNTEYAGLLTAGPGEVPQIVWYGLIAAVVVVIAKRRKLI